MKDFSKNREDFPIVVEGGWVFDENGKPVIENGKIKTWSRYTYAKPVSPVVPPKKTQY